MKLSKHLTVLLLTLGLITLTSTSAQAVLNANASIPVDGGSSIVFSPSGDRVYSASFGGKTVSSIDAATQTLISTSAVLPFAAKDIAVSPDGSKLYVLLNRVTSTANQVVVMNSSTLTVLSTITVGPNSRNIAITPDGQKLFVSNYLVSGSSTNYDNSISVIDTATQNVTYLPSVGGGTTYAFNNPARVIVSSDGLYLYVLNLNASNILKIRISDFNVVWTTAVGTVTFLIDGGVGMALSPDGTSLYVASRDSSTTTTNFLDTIDTSTGARYTNGRMSSPTGTAPGGNTNGLYDMSVSGDGTMLYVVGGTSVGFLEYSIGVDHLPTFSHTYAMSNVLRIEASPVDSTFYGGISGTVYPYGPKIGRSTQEFTKTTNESLASLGFTPTGLTGTITYSISPGLPAGLSFDTTTGVISGTPSSPLSRTVFTIKASDGSSTAAGFVILTVTSAQRPASNNNEANSVVSSSSSLAKTGMSNSLFLASGVLGLILLLLGVVLVIANLNRKKN